MVATGWLVNARLAADRETAAGATPVPVTLMLCGLVDASSVTARTALRAPTAAGAKVTLMVHVPLGGTAAMQVFAGIAKSAGLAPVKPTFAMSRLTAEPFVKVTV